MTQEATEMLARLEDLERRIEQRTKDLTDRGELSDAHETFMQGLKASHIRLKERVQSATDGAQRSPELRDELVRDYNALVDTVWRFIERQDVEAMRLPPDDGQEER